MGWLIGWSSRRELVEHLLKPSENERYTQVPIAKFFSGNNLWTVWEQRRKPTGMEAVAALSTDPIPTHRFIVLFKLDGGRNKDWGYKAVEESCGPYEVSCPLKFLDMVPPVEGDPTQGGPAKWSRDWRENVRCYWKARAERAKQRREWRMGWGRVA